MTLVTANARSNLASLIATSTGAAVALGIDKLMGGDGHGAAWVLRIGTVIYLAAIVLAIRLPDTVDVQAHAAREGDQASTGPAQANGHAAGAAAATARAAGAGPTGTAPWPVAGPDSPNARAPSARRRPFTIPHVGPVVAEAMKANAAIRVFYGFMLFFLVFILRSEHFGHVRYTFALAGFGLAVAAGGILGTVIGSALRARTPQALIFVVLGLATAASTACAILFGLWSVLAVALAAAIAQTLVKVGLDSILQRQIPEETRSSTFAFSETLHQLALVGGGLLGLLLSLTGSGFAGLTFAAAGLLIALCWLLVGRRRRIVRARLAAPSPVR